MDITLLYVAVAGDKVVSNPGTVTGSIGVIIKSSVIKDLYKKIGKIYSLVISYIYTSIINAQITLYNIIADIF